MAEKYPVNVLNDVCAKVGIHPMYQEVAGLHSQYGFNVNVGGFYASASANSKKQPNIWQH